LYVESYAALRVIDATSFVSGYQANVAGYAAIDDGGGGIFIYDPTSVLADNDGTVLAPANGIGRWLRQYSGAVNVKWFGAKGDGATNDAAAIQAAIDLVEAAGGGAVYFPATSTGYNLTSTLTVLLPNVTLRGDGPSSFLIKTNAGDILQIGDNVTQVNNTVVNAMGFQGGDATGWAINVRLAPNTIIQNSSISNSSTGSGGINMQSAWDSRILSNNFGSIKGIGINLFSSSNAVLVKGNRIDGSTPTLGTGIYVSALNIDIDGSNVIETINVGIDMLGGGCRIGAYFENNVIDIRANSSFAKNLTVENATFSGPDATSVEAIQLTVVTGYRVINNQFTGSRTGGAPITVGASALMGVIGYNTYAEAAEVTLPAQLGALDLDLISERKYFSPRNLVANSFSSWPGGLTNSPPSTWNLTGAAHTRQSDAPIGRFSCEMVGSGIGLATTILQISATKNAALRGRFVSFSVWIKSTAGTLSNAATVRISDGITNFDRSVTITTDWVKYTAVSKVGATATELRLDVFTAAAVTIRVAAPSVYVGTTREFGGIDLSQTNGTIENDATSVSHTGALAATVLKTANVDAKSMGTGGRLKVTVFGTSTGSAGAKTVELRDGGAAGTVLGTCAIPAAPAFTFDWSLDVEIINTASGSQIIFSKAFADLAVAETDLKTGSAIDTSVDFTLDVVGTLANAGDSIVVRGFIVESLNGF
jgi:hypothetical protein